MPIDGISSKPLALIGFGEAGKAFAAGWKFPGDQIKAYDIKTGSGRAEVADDKWRDYSDAGISGCNSCEKAIGGASMVFSLVTAEQSLEAAKAVALHIEKNCFFFDCNSCAPDTKRQAGRIINRAGGRYVDVAVMGPVGPVLDAIPLLTSGEHAKEALPLLAALGMYATNLRGDGGRASSIKMMRSVMVKGLEALVLECVLSARKAGVEEEVLQSLDVSYPGFDWVKRSTHMMERVMTHGIRRAEEMREVARTIGDLGLPNDLARAIAKWHQRIGEMELESEKGGRLQEHSDKIIDQFEAKPDNSGF
jgi:3-hydroxyisobutyrate dehydrogenase-like beta-hydroxyacid dehydrogenase